MEKKYTPGPWRIKSTQLTLSGGEKIPQFTIWQGYKFIGTTELSKDEVSEILNPNEEEANAKLIAAAPELLEALDDLRFLIKITPEINKQEAYVRTLAASEAAIKKATE